MRSFLLTKFPSREDFHRLYASERAHYFFSLRKQLLLAPDQIVCVTRRPTQPVMHHRVLLPIQLTYRVLVLTHFCGLPFHRGILPTYQEINNRFLVYQLQHLLKFFIRGCRLCFGAKKSQPTPATVPKLIPTFIKSKMAAPDNLIFWDFSGVLRKTEFGHQVFVLFLNYYNGHVQIYPLPDSSAKSALLALTFYIANYPVSRICSDNGSAYVSQAMREAVQSLRINHTFSPPYHPRSEGAERRMKEVKVLCRICLADAPDPSQWDTLLPHISFAINSRPNQDSALSPFELTRVYSPTSPLSRFIR